MRGMERRYTRPVILGLAAALFVAVGPAAAKMPYFSVEVSPPDPVVGEAMVVVVRLWEDVDHTQPATWPEEETIADLLEFRNDAETVPITLHRREDASYAAAVSLAAGTWRLFHFPHGRGAITDGSWGDGYPAPLTVTVAHG